ncbi:MAG: hypothetical protein ABI267_05875 [Ginsengibacter sp.]
MQKSLRAPTRRMIKKLMECHEKETTLSGKVPCLPEDMKSSLAGLYKRGFIDTKLQRINNKNILCIYVTELGKAFLFNSDQKLPELPDK